MPENDEHLISFPQYVMEELFDPGDNKQHLVEQVMVNAWGMAALNNGHFHVFEVTFMDESGTWEGAWVLHTADEWRESLRELHAVKVDVDNMITGLEIIANEGDEGNE